ncbi:hypothetical protein M378DRAFT_173201 [Amanita muscaria Koide BX008]|uniref:Uncharacterized protein n=1 Tax=Amanita muscaria (strain Koide BX008) TaxID=946122 RepID=A0A0C2WGX0_AMAMK|nr:hypothetical protein M378DRAFT_173201 [Amanita muscaria Koide BX008]
MPSSPSQSGSTFHSRCKPFIPHGLPSRSVWWTCCGAGDQTQAMFSFKWLVSFGLSKDSDTSN